MTIKLPENVDEWLDRFHQLINENEEFTKKASDWGVEFNGDLLFVLEEDPDAGLRDPLYFFFELSGGHCHDARQASPSDEEEAGYVVRGPFRKWRQILEEELDPIQAVLTGEVELEGEVNRVMQYSQAIQAVMETALDIDAELPKPGGQNQA